MNENIPVLALENVTSFFLHIRLVLILIFKCTRCSKNLSEQGHGFVYFFEIGVWELKLSMTSKFPVLCTDNVIMFYVNLFFGKYYTYFIAYLL